MLVLTLAPSFTLIADAFKTMFRSGDIAVAVTSLSPTDPELLIEVVLAERPLRAAMWDYAGRIFILSIVISVTVAGLVYGALQKTSIGLEIPTLGQKKI